MDDMREKSEVQGGTMQRREFLQKLLAAAFVLPAGGLLLSGCGGGGGSQPAPQGPLAVGVQRMRDEITDVIDQTRRLQSLSDVDLPGWTVQLNGQLAHVWPLMVAANTDALRASVSPGMSSVLVELDQLGAPLSYSGPAPTITEQRLAAAWGRAEGLLPSTTAAEQTHATSMTWPYLLMLFLLFPTISDSEALNIAGAASTADTRQKAAELFVLVHPTRPISCNSCVMNTLISRVLEIDMLLYKEMGSSAGSVPSMLLGREWLVTLMLLAAAQALFVG